MMKETAIAIRAAKAAGKIAMKHLGMELAVETKPDNSPVTIADKLCEKKIISIIRRNFPEHGIVGEESGETKGNNYKWLIDPIDGTKDFIRQAPFFSTLIALEKDNKLLSGVIFFPMLKKIVHAERGKGAYSSGKKIKVSDLEKFSNSYIIHGSLKGFYKMNRADILEKLTMGSAIRSFSSSYGFSLVAEGVSDASVEPAVHPWDLAATKIVLEEAGGRMTDFNGKDTIYSGNAIASNGKLHDELIEMVKK